MAVKKSSPIGWKIGQAYFVRTVTYHIVGELVAVDDKELWFDKAAWVADSGRFTQAITSGVLNEVEPFPSDELVCVGRGALVDAVRWNHQLPLVQK